MKIDSNKLAALVNNLEGGNVADPEVLQDVVENYADVIDVNDDAFTAHTTSLVTGANGVHGLKIEQGTFTPNLYGSTIAGNIPFNVRYGSYTRINNIVFVNIRIRTNGPASVQPTGDLRIGGLPFPVKNVTNYLASYSIAFFAYVNLPTGSVGASLDSQWGQNYISFRGLLDAGDVANVRAEDQVFGISWAANISGFYEVS